ncbi:MAG: hypothetical protein R3C03_04790 [Pirellulaceae bacterium]
MESGEVQLKWHDDMGWLPSILDELKVPTSSQVMVFSKTSLQIRNIEPDNPRAVFFNDDVYVGYVPGGKLIELSAVDSQQGAMFYSLPQLKRDMPLVKREDSACLSCHGTSKTKMFQDI